jgi:hypothetical protein
MTQKSAVLNKISPTVDRQAGRQAHGQTDGRTDGRTDGWMDGWMNLLTAVRLTPGGSSTVHIYTQTVHRTTQLI